MKTEHLNVLETDEIRADRTVEKIQCPSGKVVYAYNQEGNCFMIFGIKENIASFEDLYDRVWLESDKADKLFYSHEIEEADKFLLSL